MRRATLLLLAVGAAEPELRAELSRESVRLGEPFELALALRHEPGEGAALAPLPLLGPFALRDARCRTVAGERSALTTCELELQLLDLGEHELPPIGLAVRGPGGERRAEARGIRVRAIGVTDPAVPAASLPLREPAAPPVEVLRLAPIAWAAGLLAALALGLLALRLWRRRRSRALAAPPYLPTSATPGASPRSWPWRCPPAGAAASTSSGSRKRSATSSPPWRPGRHSISPAPSSWPRWGRSRSRASTSRRCAPPRLADLVKFARHEPAPEACAQASEFAAALGDATRPAPATQEAA
jgi:hypothetical protein